ncbi:unnamed protein product [Rhizoctonia solani]|uniref:Uncharacterized protein n=2 Tax=Rhizoctonia solani TaxID=456999 RepID=A0A8H3CPV9_9AGAM|nr:unnamed protein product [Rhizoctonia solani]CAE6489605.1 unnamed protein product [Rhizoctonia solani]
MDYAPDIDELIYRAKRRYLRRLYAIERYGRIATLMGRQRIERQQEQFPGSGAQLEIRLAHRLLDIHERTTKKFERNLSVFLFRVEEIYAGRLTYLDYPAKHARAGSSCKHQGRENEEDLKRERKSKKAAAKTRKSRRDETKEDHLVEREEDSAVVMQLRVYALKLEPNCQQMRAALTRREKRDSVKPRKIIAEPENQSDTDVELIRMYLNILGEIPTHLR